MSALPSSRKTHSEKHKQILRQLLKEPANKTCVDCKTATHPRWASWNLGGFICIRCSGIHRSMGTHISRVKSVDLDVWTDEQVESMVKWGNEKCNLFWEDKLPPNYTPDPSKIENFIRTKYDMKKWAASARVPDPMSVAKAAAPAPVAKESAQPQKPAAASLLDDDFGSFTSSSAPAQARHATKEQPRLPPHSASPANTASPPTAPPQRNDKRSDLKKSILSLYSTPTSSQSSFHSSNSTLNGPALDSRKPAVASNDSVNSMSNSLLGLSFASDKPHPVARSQMSSPAFSNQSPVQPSPAAPAKPSTPQPAAPSPSWNNEWSDSSPSGGNQWNTPSYNGTTSGTSVLGASLGGTFTPASNNSSKALDDDLFKNVWS